MKVSPMKEWHFSLRWKMSLSYLGVTLLTIISLELVIFLFLSLGSPIINRHFLPLWAQWETRHLSREVEKCLKGESPRDINEVLEDFSLVELNLNMGMSGNTGVNRALVYSNGELHPLMSAQDQFDSFWFIGATLRMTFPLAEQHSFYRDAQGYTLSWKVDAPLEDNVFLLISYPAIGPRQGILPILRTLGLLTLMLLPFLILFSWIFGAISSKPHIRKIQHIGGAAQALNQGNLSYRLNISGRDEFADLARDIDGMADSLEQQRKTIRENLERQLQFAVKEKDNLLFKERARIAMELHDGVKQYLFSINLAASYLLGRMDKGLESKELQERLNEIKDMNQRAQVEMVSLLKELKGGQEKLSQLIPVIKGYLKDFERSSSIKVLWDFPKNPEIDVDSSVGHNLLRILQEALYNALRHGKPSEISVVLELKDSLLELNIEDNGAGFPSKNISEGKGLENMQNRAEGLGGSLFIQSKRGQGTQIKLMVPLSLKEVT